MRGGKLRHRITIEQYTQARDDNYEMTETWSTYAVVSASIEPLSGRERFSADQKNAELDGVVKIRYHDNVKLVNPKMRIRHGSRILRINSVVNFQELNREIHIYYKEDTD